MIGQKGGQVRAVQQREKAIKAYYEKPNVCPNCHQIIKVIEGQKVCETRKKRFCSRSCAANFKEKAEKAEKAYKKCECGKAIDRRSSSCRACNATKLSKIGLLSKRQLKERRANSYQNWRSSIQKHAKTIYDRSDKPKECCICGYNKHYEVCHIVDVANFEEDSLINSINAIENLVALCPNHHWEFDHGLLDITNAG
jgi:hypothetical protein